MQTSIKKKQLALFSFYSFSLQFATTIQLANTSSLLSLLGAKGQVLANLWLSGPIIGLVMGIMSGQLSDMTHTRYGKRKPYIMISGIILSLALGCLPFSQNLVEGTLFLLLFYTGINGCTWPLQAWIGDSFSKANLSIAYTVQSIGMGLGGMTAGAFTSFIGSHWPNINFGTNFSLSSIQISFFLAVTVILLSTFLLCRYIKEDVPEKKKTNSKTFRLKSLSIHTSAFIKTIYENIICPPAFLKKILLSQLFLWYAIYCLWVYLPLAIAQHFCGLPPGDTLVTLENAKQAVLLAKGTNLTAVCYGIAQVSGALFIVYLPFLLKKIQEGRLFAMVLFVGGSSLILGMVCHRILILYLSMIGLGILMESFLAIPFIALTKELPAAKRGGGLGVFNLTVTAPQLVSGLTVGQIHEHLFKGHADTTVFSAGVLILIAALFATPFFFMKR